MVHQRGQLARCAGAARRRRAAITTTATVRAAVGIRPDDSEQRRPQARMCCAAMGLSLAAILSAVNIEAEAPQGRSDAPSVFEVASVRQRTPAADASGAGGGAPISRKGTRFTASNASLRELIRYAFDLEPFDLAEGGPRLLDQRFDIAATLPASATASDAPRAMLRTLLADRFKLSTRWETRQQMAFVLVRTRTDDRLARGLKRATVDCATHERVTPLSSQVAKSSADQIAQLTRPTCDMIYQPFQARVFGSARSMADLARLLSRMPGVRAPVVDQTGLSGAYDFEFEFAPERPLSATGSPDSGSVSQGPSLFAALEEQLGLRLERRRTDTRVLVVERVEPPTEN
jgi:uncharacterized protein (TIGR03435 family)